jgi:alpha-glucosidase
VRNVADQRDDATSLLTLYRELIALRRRLGDGFEVLDAPDGVVAYRRGDHTVAVNTTAEPRHPPVNGEVVLATAPFATDGSLPPHGGAIVR